MKILFIIANMPGGGSERVLANLANEFVSRGIEVSLLMTAGNEVAYKMDNRVSLISLGHRSGGSLAKRIKRIGAMRKAFQVDKETYLISFGTETNLFSVLSAAFLPNKLILSERNDPNQCHFRLLRNILYHFADFHVFQTEDARNCFAGSIRKKSAVIPNPLDKALPAVYTGERRNVIAAVGRLAEQKNHSLLLQAFALFSKQLPEYCLEIFGQGELLEELQRESEELGIRKKVSFMGFEADVLERIKNCTMYVLSSDYEGISNSLAEAMAIGLPVVATDCPIGGSKMCIRHQENGLLVPIKDSEALAEAMLLLARDGDIAERLSQNAALIRDELGLKRITDMWLEVLRK